MQEMRAFIKDNTDDARDLEEVLNGHEADLLDCRAQLDKARTALPTLRCLYERVRKPSEQAVALSRLLTEVEAELERLTRWEKQIEEEQLNDQGELEHLLNQAAKQRELLQGVEGMVDAIISDGPYLGPDV